MNSIECISQSFCSFVNQKSAESGKICLFLLDRSHNAARVYCKKVLKSMSWYSWVNFTWAKGPGQGWGFALLHKTRTAAIVCTLLQSPLTVKGLNTVV
jgi:hypothetical protein